MMATSARRAQRVRVANEAAARALRVERRRLLLAGERAKDRRSLSGILLDLAFLDRELAAHGVRYGTSNRSPVVAYAGGDGHNIATPGGLASARRRDISLDDSEDR
jgi:hypothetical protein